MTKFDVFFLGTSAGIPSVDRNMPSIAIKWNGKVYLFDAGEGCQKQLMKYKVGYGSIENIFITHLHLDHFLGYFGLVETLRMTTDKEYSGLNVYAPKGFSSLLFNNWEFVKINKIRQGPLYEGNEISITAFRTKHVGLSFGFVILEKDKVKFDAKKAKKLGIVGKMFSSLEKKGEIKVNNKIVKLEEVSRIVSGRKIVYTGDTAYSENTVEYSKNADLLIHECTFDEDMQEHAKKTNHSTVIDAAKVAAKAKVKTLVLTHISARYKEEDLEKFVLNAKKYFKGKIVVAHDGMKMEL